VHRVHQGLAGSVFLLKTIKIIAADFKGSYAPGCVLDPDSMYGSSLAKEESTDIDICCLVVLGDRSSPPLSSPGLIFCRRYDRRKDLRHLMPGFCSHQPETLASMSVGGFFLSNFL